jgi:hypothetical protein
VINLCYIIREISLFHIIREISLFPYVNNSFALKCTCGNGNRIKSFNHLTFNVNVNRMLNCFECNVWVTTCHKRYFSKHVSITGAISSEKSHYFISSEKSHYFLKLTIQPLPRSILIYSQYSGIGSPLFS